MRIYCQFTIQFVINLDLKPNYGIVLWNYGIANMRIEEIVEFNVHILNVHEITYMR